MIGVAYLLAPVLWAPIDARFYNYFQAKRRVEPWNEVVVIGIDGPTRSEVLERPVYPLSRHVAEHARVVRALGSAGARAVVLDLELTPESLGGPPRELADAIADVGDVYLVTSLREQLSVDTAGNTVRSLLAVTPDTMLLHASRGAYVVDIETDPDGVVRRFRSDPRLERIGLTTLPEELSGVKIEGTVPIEFPSVSRPVPTISYRELLEEAAGVSPLVQGRIAFVGLTGDSTLDTVTVPRLQRLADGVQGFRLSGVVLLAALTETFMRGAPLRDASWPLALLWNVLWSVLIVLVVPWERTRRAVPVAAAVVACAVAATGALHIFADLILPGGLLFGCVLLSGGRAFVSASIRTAGRLQVERAERERVQRELAVARETQERFLPAELPSVEGVDLWGVNVSSLEVSGDYYDVLSTGDRGTVILAIADVSGKGLPAALVMSTVQAGLHCHLLEETPDVGHATDILNKLVCSNTDPGKFVTFFLAEYDPRSRALRYARAGHDPPIVVGTDGVARRLRTGGLVLGFTPDSEYEVEDEVLDAGEVLCLYTDGVTEARNPEGDELEPEGLERILAENRGRTAAEIGQAVVDEVRSYTGLEHQADDVTVVVLKVPPGGASSTTSIREEARS